VEEEKVGLGYQERSSSVTTEKRNRERRIEKGGSLCERGLPWGEVEEKKMSGEKRNGTIVVL
jgi:hypothetical protein